MKLYLDRRKIRLQSNKEDVKLTSAKRGGGGGYDTSSTPSVHQHILTIAGISKADTPRVTCLG